MKTSPRSRLSRAPATGWITSVTMCRDTNRTCSRMTAVATAAFLAWKRGLTGALARLVARLHGLDRFHKDLYLCHFFIPENDTRSIPANWDLAMIDLHRLNCHRLTAAWWRLKDLAQLLYSSDVFGVTARDRLRFARLYAPENRRSLSWRFTRWAVGVRWKNYERHNQARKMNRAA